MASAGIWASSFHRLLPHFFFIFFFDRLVKQDVHQFRGAPRRARHSERQQAKERRIRRLVCRGIERSENATVNDASRRTGTGG